MIKQGFPRPRPLSARNPGYQLVGAGNPSTRLTDWGMSRENAELFKTQWLVFSQLVQKLEKLAKNKLWHSREFCILL